MEKRINIQNKPVRQSLIASVSAKLVLNDCSPIIGDSLSPDNIINPPARISCKNQDNMVVYNLSSFKSIETMNNAVMDILNAARFAENVLEVTENKS